MSTFLPNSVIEEISKEASSAGRYINPSKLTGEVRLRFLGIGITGFESWTTDNKPIRWETKPEELPANVRKQEGYQPIKRFLAGAVYDYASDEFKILQITQRTLMDQLFKYMSDEDYGDPTGYDIKIGKTGEGKETKYTLVPSPPKPLKSSVLERFDETPCDLSQLFEGGDPFAEPSA
jgi:hypothetical protein